MAAARSPAMLKIIRNRGCLAVRCEGVVDRNLTELVRLVEPAWQEAASKRDGPSDFHLTVVDPQECTTEIEEQLLGLGVCEDELCILGLGAAPGCNFAVVHCSRLQHMRLSAGLELKDLHITLGFAGKDRHDVNKGLHSLRTWSGNGEVVAFCLEKDGGALGEIVCKRSARLLLRQRLHEVSHSAGGNDAYTPNERTRCLELSLKSAYQCGQDSRLTDSLRAELCELDPVAALFLATKYAINVGILSGMEASEHVHAELRNLPEQTRFNDRLSWLAEQARQAALKEDAMWGKDNAGLLTLIKIPLNCAPVVGTENKLRGSGNPSNTSVRAILQIGLARVVSLTEEPPSCKDEVADARQLRFFHFPIRDRHAPESLKELLLICRCVQQGLAQARGQRGGVLVHCLGGKGRTVLVLAAVLMMEKSLSPSAALAQVKTNRNTCVTEEQVRALKQLYAATSVRAMRPPAQAAGSLPKSLPRLLVFCGLPGAGKSTFCQELIRQFPSSVRHINQDELGGKETETAWSAAAMSAARDGKIVAVLDKCNLTQAKRKSDYASLDPASRSKITLVYFSMGVDLCTERAAARVDHIGEVTGERARRIVRDMAQKCEAPVSAESEGVGTLHVVQDDAAGLALLRSWGCAEPEEERQCVVCFPRTRHLKNLGSATDDDLQQEDASSFLMKTHEDDRIVVEEKVDGANLGLRLGEDGFRIVAQNRSHIVHSKYHEQFRKLDKWILDHSDVLRHVLRDQNLILYGEWVYALHSTSYDRLPGYFVAFDLRCVLTDTFVSRPELELMLRGTGIPQTPLLLSEPSAPSRPRANALLAEILKLVGRKSMFAQDTCAEGVYVRVQRGLLTVDRAKIVRPHFKGGNEHWSKGGVTINELSREAQEAVQTAGAAASAALADARASAVPAEVVAEAPQEEEQEDAVPEAAQMPADVVQLLPESPMELHRSISQHKDILAWPSEQLSGAFPEDDIESLVIGVEMILADESTPLEEAVQSVTDMPRDQNVSEEGIQGFTQQAAGIPQPGVNRLRLVWSGDVPRQLPAVVTADHKMDSPSKTQAADEDRADSKPRGQRGGRSHGVRRYEKRLGSL